MRSMTTISFLFLLLLLSKSNLYAACQDESASGFFRVGGMEIYFEDKLPEEMPDGLPESYKCNKLSEFVSLNKGTEQVACNEKIIIIVGTAENDSYDYSRSTLPVAFFGGYGDDQFTGSQFSDAIHGSFGADYLKGKGGDDQICLTDSRPGVIQYAFGGKGNDYIFGGLEPSVLYGGAGNDTLQGGGKDDFLNGGEGNDALFGGFHKDTLIGESGNDFLHGGEGEDELKGGKGNDRLIGSDRYFDSINAGREVSRDVCTIDTNLDVHEQCEKTLELPKCGRVLFAARTNINNKAEVWLLDPSTGQVKNNSFANPITLKDYTKITGLAVSPICKVFAIFETDLGSRLGTIEMETSKVTLINNGVIGANKKVEGIAFDAVGNLIGLIHNEKRFDLIKIDKNNPNNTSYFSSINRETTSPAFIAFDSPEGYLFVTSFREGTIDFDGIDSYLGFISFVHETDKSHPITMDSKLNNFIEIDENGNFWRRERRYARITPLGYSTPEGVDNITAITMPHFD